jgi:hypothetical protein
MLSHANVNDFQFSNIIAQSYYLYCKVQCAPKNRRIRKFLFVACVSCRKVIKSHSRLFLKQKRKKISCLWRENCQSYQSILRANGVAPKVRRTFTFFTFLWNDQSDFWRESTFNWRNLQHCSVKKGNIERKYIFALNLYCRLLVNDKIMRFLARKTAFFDKIFMIYFDFLIFFY